MVEYTDNLIPLQHAVPPQSGLGARDQQDRAEREMAASVGAIPGAIG
jgi:hypothetical protein